MRYYMLIYGFFVLYKLFGWENLDTYLSRNELDIDILVYWYKLLLNLFRDFFIYYIAIYTHTL